MPQFSLVERNNEYVQQNSELPCHRYRKCRPALVKAYRRLPEDKRSWQPWETARSAQDQIIECVLLAGYTAELIHTHHFPASQRETYASDEAKCLERSVEEFQAQLRENVAKVGAAIRDANMSVPITMP